MSQEPSSPVAQGSCLCGGVRYTIRGPFHVFRYCHCSRCRKATGSAHASNLFVAPDRFRWTAGEALVVRYDLPQARSFATCFCRLCGSPLPHATRSGEEIVVPAGSLDVDPGCRPEHSIFRDHGAAWYEDPASLPSFAERPPSDG